MTSTDKSAVSVGFILIGMGCWMLFGGWAVIIVVGVIAVMWGLDYKK